MGCVRRSELALFSPVPLLKYFGVLENTSPAIISFRNIKGMEPQRQVGQEIHPSGKDHNHPGVLQATWLLYSTPPLREQQNSLASQVAHLLQVFWLALSIMTNLVICPLKRPLLSYYPRPNTFSSDNLQPLSVAALDKRTHPEVKALLHCAHKYLLSLMQPFQFTYLSA